MVKNTKGGNKTKKQAKKNYTQGRNYKLRKSEDPNEIYAIVTKLYGNGRILIKCNDGIERNCIIRKKFRGRNKRDNEITIDTLILAGRRDWQNNNIDKLETCDLLEVYSIQDRNELKTDSTIKWSILQTSDIKEKEQIVDFLNIDGIDSESEESENDSENNDENVVVHQEENLITDCFGEEVNIDEI